MHFLEKALAGFEALACIYCEFPRDEGEAAQADLIAQRVRTVLASQRS